MKEITCTIEGISPLMMYRYIHGYATPKVVEDVRAECAKRLHTVNGSANSDSDEEAEVVVPQEALFRTLMNGGKFEKLGKKQVTTEKSSLLPGYAVIPGIEFELDHEQRRNAHRFARLFPGYQYREGRQELAGR